VPISIPPLDNVNTNRNGNNNGAGYYLVVQLDTPSYIDALWTLPAGTQDNIQLFVYSNTPTNQFAGQPDPTSLSPPSGQLVISAGGTSNSLEVRTPQSNLTGSYTAYFFSLDQSLSTSSNATLEYRSTHCP
jgi:hypothetical protein